MSAFLCSEKHISALVNVTHLAEGASAARFALYHDGVPHDDQGMFRMLLDANLLSLDARYGEGDSISEAAGYTYRADARAESAVELLKLINCFDYQACEDDSWEASLSRRWLDFVRDHVAQDLPGYDTAEWAI